MRVAVAVILIVLVLGVGYAGPPPAEVVADDATVTATPLPLAEAGPAPTRAGRLTFLGGVRLASPDRAFGGFSALAVAGDRFLLLSDSGSVLGFAMGADWRLRGARFGRLPAGPGTGWEKRERDSEALARDPRTGELWVGFERANAIWRYAPGFGRVLGAARPPAMRGWESNGGAESLVRYPDGSFVAIAESSRWRGTKGRAGLVFRGDPTAAPGRGFRFIYRPAPGFEPSDAAMLPDGDLLVLERRFAPPFRFEARLAVVARAAIRPGAIVRGRTVARLAAPLRTENYEGLAITREGAATIVWLASDNDQSRWRPTLLMKFRLD